MEEKEVVKTEEKEVVTVEESVVTESAVTKKKKSKLWIFIVILFIAIALLAGAIVAVVTFKFPSEKPTGEVPGVEVAENYLDYKIVDNSLGDFDIRFLQTDNDRENKVYSIQRINMILKDIKKKYGIKSVKNFSSHSLRKTMGRHVYERADSNGEMALVMLSELFNHSNIAITKRYLGLRKEEILGCYDLLDF